MGIPEEHHLDLQKGRKEILDDLTIEFWEFHDPSLLPGFRDVSRVDSLGITMLHRLEEFCGERGINVHRWNVPDTVERFLEYYERHPCSD